MAGVVSSAADCLLSISIVRGLVQLSSTIPVFHTQGPRLNPKMEGVKGRVCLEACWWGLELTLPPPPQWSGLQMTSACLKPVCGLVLIVLAAVLLVKELLLPTNQAPRPEIWNGKQWRDPSWAFPNRRLTHSLFWLAGPDPQAPGVQRAL